MKGLTNTRQTFRKWTSGVLAAAMLTGACLAGASSVIAQGDGSAAAEFDENNIVLSFSTISDTHIQGGTSSLSASKFKKAMAQLGKRDQDAIIINGDITDYGTTAQITDLRDLLDYSSGKGQIDLTETKLLLNMGNHELFDAEIYQGDQGGGIPTQAEAKPHYHGATTYKNILGDRMYTDEATAEQIELGYNHTVINGYHVILFSLFDYNHGLRFEEKELEWLKADLAAAQAEDPNKPIFFAMHAMIEGTTLGSNYGNYWATNSKELYDTLAQYPQLITFGSHLHYPLQDERSIYQGDFTSVETASVYFASLEAKATNPKTGEIMQFQNLSGPDPDDRFEVSQGVYVEVDANNNTRITRLDFANKGTIKEPWIIPAPSDPDHLNRYSEEVREVGNTAPTFAEGDTVVRDEFNLDEDPLKNFLSITYSTADDNDLVRSYEISFISIPISIAAPPRIRWRRPAR